MTQTKVCSKCGIDKPLSEYHKDSRKKLGVRSDCKECRKPVTKKYYEENKEEINRKGREHYWENVEYYRKQSKEWHHNNKEYANKCSREYYKNNKEKVKKANEEWYENNKERYDEWKRDYIKERKENDIGFKLSILFRDRINKALKNNYKSKSSSDLLGCSVKEARQYLEDQFEEGMNWDNHGIGEDCWQIDHVIPISFWDLNCEYQRSVCFHYSNIQPLWFLDNDSKHNKIPNLFEEIEIDQEFLNSIYASIR